MHGMERSGRSYLSITCSADPVVRLAQAARDHESCFFVRAAGVPRFLRRYRVKKQCLLLCFLLYYIIVFIF